MSQSVLFGTTQHQQTMDYANLELESRSKLFF